MTPSQPAQDAQSIYDFWLRLIPGFLGQVGDAGAGAKPGTGAGDGASLVDGLLFPTDQFMKAATATQQSLQTLAQSIAPTLRGGIPNLFGEWAATLAPFSFAKPGDAMTAANAATQAMLAPWNAMMASIAGAPPGATTATASLPGSPAALLPLQALNQSWVNFASGLAEMTSGQLATAFDRTYGALSDALGLGPARRLQAAWQEMIAAGIAQQEARANYALLVQAAIAQGLQRLMARLAEKADKRERIDSVLTLLRLWAVCTEEVVHETLQSEPGLAATAALTRLASAYRKRVQHVASIVADVLDMATRRELDEAYREIQTLKRELRALRSPRGPVTARSAPARAQNARPAARRAAKSRNQRRST